jgi:predicted RNA-binding Zn-ribbon protein involved in translation (DUF1610 family)
MPKEKSGARSTPFDKDVMTSPAVKANQQKCPSCGQDIMTSPAVEANKHKCPSCGEDITAIPKNDE